jgi:ribosome biogenesis GTPase A
MTEKMEHLAAKGIQGRPIRAMVVGIPNIGKSSLINQLTGGSQAKTGNKPGVTRGNQWIRIHSRVELLDTPGMLWPKFEDEAVGKNLAFTGAIRDDIMDLENLAFFLGKFLAAEYPDQLGACYGFEGASQMTGLEVLENVAKRRGYILKGAEYDHTRAARTLLDDFRAGRIGRITLDLPKAGGDAQ